MSAVILLSRGGYGNAPGEQLQKLVTALQASGHRAYGAFVDAGSPSLPEALAQCMSQQDKDILIVPIYLPTDRSLQSWITKVVRRWLIQHPDSALTIRMSEPLGDSEELAQAVEQMIERDRQFTPLPLEAGHIQPNSPEWSVLLPHERHVLVCRGPRCTTAGAGEVAGRLMSQLKTHELDDAQVLVAQTGCLYPCNLGPIMVVYPERAWYCGLDAEAVDQIVEQHFVAGHIVERYTRHPSNEAQQRP
jgi:(2Fe-2S) ferredoxin